MTKYLAKTPEALVHPGELLLEEFLKPAGVSQYRLAKATGISEGNLSGIINGRLGVTAGTALRLGKALKMTPDFWMNAQSQYDLSKASMESREALEKVEAVL